MVAGGLLLCGGAGVAMAGSGGSRCEAFEGKVTLTPLATCDTFKTVMGKERFFEDATFLFDVAPGIPMLCFSGTIVGAKLGGRDVEASSLSALTANSFCLLDGSCSAPIHPAQRPLLTAATVVTVSADREPRKDKELGQIFLRDTAVTRPGPEIDGLPPIATAFAVEQLIGVGGTKKFSNASVSMEIVGPAFGSGADVKGTICR